MTTAASDTSGRPSVLTVVARELVTAPARSVARLGRAVVRSGLHRRPLEWKRDRVVLLFFEDFERDTAIPGDRHLRRAARKIAHATRAGQRSSGLGVAFDRLVQALRAAGCHVIVNDRRLARRNPAYPVGLAGYPGVIDYLDLPNPQLIGHGPYDHPNQNPTLMDDPRRRVYIAASPWVAAMFEPGYPGKNEVWFAGIDLDEWPDYAHEPKELDFVLYDKIRWDHDRVRGEVRVPVEETLRARGLRYEVLVYGEHDQAAYRSALKRTRGLIFLCEHENQGLAYQEAMATGVPVLAWDPGEWHDPNRFSFGVDHVPASSVPYFADGVTGERFRSGGEFSVTLDRFLAALGSYASRPWVARNLSLALSAERYLELYTSLLPDQPSP